MNLKEINQEIKEAGLINTEKFLYKFLEHEDKVVHQLQKFDGLQSEIYLHNNPNELEQIKFASIFSDFVSLYTGNSSTNDSHITYFDEKSEHFRERKITIPSSLSSEIIPSEQSLIAGYVHPSTKDTQDAIK